MGLMSKRKTTMVKHGGGSRVSGFVTGAVLWTYAGFAIAPLLAVLVNSFRPTSDIVTTPTGLPTSLYLDNYVTALVAGGFIRYLSNTLLMTTAAVLLATVVSVLAAYALTRWNLPGGQLIMLIFLAGIMMPIRFTVLPLFYEIDSLGLLDTQLGLILFYAASGIPLSTFVLVPFIRQLPVELEEAAAIDGAGPVATFVRIVAPMLRSALAVILVFNFVPLWNEFYYPLILMRSPEKLPAAVGLTTFFSKYAVDLGPLFASLVLVTAPLVVLFLLATRRIIDGLSAGMSR